LHGVKITDLSVYEQKKYPRGGGQNSKSHHPEVHNGVGAIARALLPDAYPFSSRLAAVLT